MLANYNFCGIQILNCAKIISSIGIALSIISIISSIVSSTFISLFMDLCLLGVYVAAFYGVHHKREGFLYPVLIVLGINIFLIFLAIIILLTITPYTDNQNIKSSSTAVIIIASLQLAFAGFSFLVFYRARTYMLEELCFNFSTPPYTPDNQPLPTPMTPQNSNLIGLQGVSENAKIIA